MVYNKLDCFVSVFFIENRNMYFDRYYENLLAFSKILREYLNSVKLDYMSC